MQNQHSKKKWSRFSSEWDRQYREQQIVGFGAIKCYSRNIPPLSQNHYMMWFYCKFHSWSLIFWKLMVNSPCNVFGYCMKISRLLLTFVVPQLTKDCAFQKHNFMRDGAYSILAIDRALQPFLCLLFTGDRIISRFCMAWPPRCPDLTYLNFGFGTI